MPEQKHSPDRPGVIIFPPLLFGIAMVLGYLLDWLFPVQLLPTTAARLMGWTLILFGGVLGFFAVRILRHAGTNVSPHQPTIALVTQGPYSRTRNPLYVAALGVCLGVAFLVNGIAPLLLLPPLILLLNWGIVRREERYLGAKFGEAYRNYQRQVRRWL